jgi:hypothetical protein
MNDATTATAASAATSDDDDRRLNDNPDEADADQNYSITKSWKKRDAKWSLLAMTLIGTASNYSVGMSFPDNR